MNINSDIAILEQELSLLQNKLYTEPESVMNLLELIIEWGRNGLQADNSSELDNCLNTIVGLASDALDLLGCGDQIRTTIS